MPDPVTHIGVRIRDMDAALRDEIDAALAEGKPVIIRAASRPHPVSAGAMVPQGTGWSVFAADGSWHHFICGEDALAFAREQR